MLTHINPQYLWTYLKNGEMVGYEYRSDCPSPKCPNPKEHFYTNWHTGKAFCHRCNIGFESLKALEIYLKKHSTPGNPATILEYEKSTGDRVSSQKKLTWHSSQYLKRRGVGKKEIEEYNIRQGTGNWEDYIIFTCSNTGYQFGRSVFAKGLRYKYPKGQPKKESLFTHPNLSPTNPAIVLVEGVFDVIRIDQAMLFPIAVALMGSYITKEQLYALRTFETIFVWLDPDAAVKGDVIRTKLREEGHTVYNVRSEHDPGDTPHSVVRTLLQWGAK